MGVPHEQMNSQTNMDGIRVMMLVVLSWTVAVDSVKQKNVLMIVVDDLRPSLGSYKDESAYTPHIDRLARKSVQFNFAYAQQALCAPSRNSLLTSRRPDSLRLYDFYSYWRDVAGNFTTLPQHFKQHGYITASFGKVFHPGASSNWCDDWPYSWSIKPFHASTQRYKDSAVCTDGSGELRKNLVCPVEVARQPGGTLPDIEILHAVQNFLTNYSYGKPFFAAVGFHKPHIPFKFPSKYLERHPLGKVSKPICSVRPPGLPQVAWNPWTDVRHRDDILRLNVSFPYGPMPDNMTQLIRQSYYAAVTYIDDLIGQLMETLKTGNMHRDTIIVLLGDHGWSMGEHAEWAKYSNYEVAVRVPLLLYDPDLVNTPPVNENTIPDNVHLNCDYSTPRIQVRNQLVELVDIFPTVCELANITMPPLCQPSSSIPQDLCTEGQSLVPIMLESDHADIKGKSAVFSQYPRPSAFPRHDSDEPRLSDIKIMGYSMGTERYRYTEWVAFKHLTPLWDQVIATEMYDHRIDPNECLNLAGRPGLQDLQRILQRQLRAGWRAAMM